MKALKTNKSSKTHYRCINWNQIL